MRTWLALTGLLLTSCVGAAPLPVDVGGIRGRVEGLRLPETGRIEIYRLEPSDLAIRTPSSEVAPNSSGRFRTGVLAAGRYLLALRAPARPISTARVVVPTDQEIVLRARQVSESGDLEVRRGAAGAGAQGVRVSRVEDGAPVAEVHRAAFDEQGVARLEGLSAGRWRIDLTGLGWTAEVDVAGDGRISRLDLAPPSLPPLGSAEMRGRVIRPDSRPARGVVVTVRPLLDGNATQGARSSIWGRYAVTDSDGGYHIVGIPAGRALLRLECRDTVYPLLPVPEAVPIPPSGTVERSFVIGR